MRNVEKDVHRTDRNVPLFAGEDIPHPDPDSPFAEVGTNVHLEQMKDMLMTYNEYNKELGYVQGMSDLLAPIYAVMQDDAVAFWGFQKFMERMVRYTICLVIKYTKLIHSRNATTSATNPACACSSPHSISSSSSWTPSSIYTFNLQTAQTSSSSSACYLSGTSESSPGTTCSPFGNVCGPTSTVAISTSLWL